MTHEEATEEADRLVKGLPPLNRARATADFFDVTTRTIKEWVATGRLRAVRAIPGGTSRVLVTRNSIRDLLARSLEAVE